MTTVELCLLAMGVVEWMVLCVFAVMFWYQNMINRATLRMMNLLEEEVLNLPERKDD